VSTLSTASDVQRPTPEELAARQRAGQAPVIVDVRTPAEFESAHIEGSYNLPLDVLRAHAAEVATCGPLVVVCQQGIRSREAEGALRAAGGQAVSLEGGLAAWERAGLPLVRGRERWSIERQVRGVAGSLVLAGALGGLFVARPLALLAAAIGGGLVFSALTNTCGMARLLERLPYNRAGAPDPAATIAAIRARAAHSS
jgi:rhodanese-related sulfurtransferase